MEWVRRELCLAARYAKAKYWWQERNVEMALHHWVGSYWTKQNVSF